MERMATRCDVLHLCLRSRSHPGRIEAPSGDLAIGLGGQAMNDSLAPVLIGEAFPPDDLAGQWVVEWSMAMNDLVTLDTLIHDALKADRPEGPYYLRLLCGPARVVAAVRRRRRRHCGRAANRKPRQPGTDALRGSTGALHPAAGHRGGSTAAVVGRAVPERRPRPHLPLPPCRQRRAKRRAGRRRASPGAGD